MRPILPLLLGLLCGACYTYEPSAPPEPVGARLRVRLSDEAALRYSRERRELRREVEGTVVSANQDAVVLSVPGPDIPREFRRSAAVADTLRLGRQDAVAVEEEVFSTTRTALLAAGLGTVAALLVEFAVGEGGDPGGSEDPRPVRSVILGAIQALTSGR